jgi:hypothetical protein
VADLLPAVRKNSGTLRLIIFCLRNTSALFSTLVVQEIINSQQISGKLTTDLPTSGRFWIGPMTCLMVAGLLALFPPVHIWQLAWSVMTLKLI